MELLDIKAGQVQDPMTRREASVFQNTGSTSALYPSAREDDIPADRNCDAQVLGP